MRIGEWEISILGILANDGGSSNFREIKEKLSGHSRLKFRRMGWGPHHVASTKHKAIARAARTLEEKGLIIRKSHSGYYGQVTSIFRLEITDKGLEEYLKRV